MLFCVLGASVSLRYRLCSVEELWSWKPGKEAGQENPLESSSPGDCTSAHKMLPRMSFRKHCSSPGHCFRKDFLGDFLQELQISAGQVFPRGIQHLAVVMGQDNSSDLCNHIKH